MIRFVRNDAISPSIVAPDKGYEIRDERDRLLGVVAGSGRLWASGRIGPRRSMPVIPVAVAESRGEAARLLVQGRP